MKKRWLFVCSIAGIAASSNELVAKDFAVRLDPAAGSAQQDTSTDHQELYISRIFEATDYFNRNFKFFAGSIGGLGLEYLDRKVAFGLGVGYRYDLYGPDDPGPLQHNPDKLDDMSGPGDSLTITSFLEHSDSQRLFARTN